MPTKIEHTSLIEKCLPQKGWLAGNTAKSNHDEGNGNVTKSHLPIRHEAKGSGSGSAIRSPWNAWPAKMKI